MFIGNRFSSTLFISIFLLIFRCDIANCFIVNSNLRYSLGQQLSAERFLTKTQQLNHLGARANQFSEIRQSLSDVSTSLQGKTDVNYISVPIARAVLLIVSAFYGTNFGCVKILGEVLDPSIAALFRFSLAALVFAPDLVRVANSNRRLVLGGIEVGFLSALGYWGQSEALLTSSASATAFICSLAVIVVPLLDLIFKKNSKPWHDTILPAGLAVVGIACLELGGSTLPVVGDLWAFMQPLMFGLGFWRIEQHMKLMSGGRGEAQAFTGAMMLMVAVYSFIWSFTSFFLPNLGTPDLLVNVSKQIAALQDWHVLAAIGWTGIVTTAITSYGENVAMTKLSATESTVIYSTEPLWGTAFAALALHESIGWNTIVGALFVVTACLWSAVGPTVSLAGIYSSFKGILGPGGEEIVDNILENWNELFSKFASISTPDL